MRRKGTLFLHLCVKLETSMKEIRLDGFIETFKSASKIVITNHTNPDGDAMGSALALQQVLEKMGKKVSVVVPNPYPKFLWHLHGNERVLIYAEVKLQVMQ